jgi:hypothetical protein
MLATTIHKSNTTPHHQREATTHEGVVSKPNSVSGSLLDRFIPPGQTFVVHPVSATTAADPITASPPPCAGMFSWCSLERR